MKQRKVVAAKNCSWNVMKNRGQIRAHQRVWYICTMEEKVNIIFFQDWFKPSLVVDSFWGDVRSVAVKNKPFVLGGRGDFGLGLAMTETYQL